MQHIHRLIIIAACGLPCGLAAAQPSPPVADKADARSLMQSGLKLYAAQDYLGALAVFRTAYTRFPSAKILINIGTTLIKLDRKADAANTYQHYLDAPDTDPAKAAEVEKVLADLDSAVGTLDVTIAPGDAELQFNSEDWIRASTVRRHRVTPGSVTVRARRAAYQPDERELQLAPGETVRVALNLVAVPTPSMPTTPAAPTTSGPAAPITAAAVDPSHAPSHTAHASHEDAESDREIESTAALRGAPMTRFGVTALAHIDVRGRGGAGLVGGTFDLTSRVRGELTAILGPSYGGYAGARVAILDRGKLRPILAAGAPIFMSHGARVALRGAGGVELELSQRVALTLELGVEHMLNAEADVQYRTMFVPAIGATGRL